MPLTPATLRGIIPPMTTPFTADGQVDEAAFQTEVRHLIRLGVHGLAVGGSTGEGHTLTTPELRQLITLAVDAAAGQVPVIAGIIADDTRTVIERGLAVREVGVAALQITPVHYLFPPTDPELLAFYAAIGQAVGLPIVIYNVIPWAYASPALLIRLMTEIEEVIGVKQSAGDLQALAELLLHVGDRGAVLSAVDALLYPSFALGAHGAIAAILTAVPGLCLALWEAVHAGQHGAARQVHERLLRVWLSLVGPRLPARVKAAMQMQGRAAGWPRAPMQPVSEAEQQAIRAALTDAGVLAGP